MSGPFGMLAAGGPVIWLLIALSVFSLALIAAKVWQMRAVLSGAELRERAYALWAQGDRVGAGAALRDGRAPADRIALAAMQGLLAGQRRPGLDADLEWRGNAELAAMNRHLRLLDLIAMVSPLLGLLGTVLGMIKAFQELAMAEGAANASLLAGGIWEALLTTAAGLLVAIPAAVAAGLLADRADRAALLIEAAVGRLFTLEEARR
ncbi:MotA/TolQ/ExbB proton channel family protein [Paracoccaceae bacterium Fryx2]|nr:MotA/TolQ/ExbB proton channel family protein [Paracoccaceae bacterium Fryx2]